VYDIEHPSVASRTGVLEPLPFTATATRPVNSASTATAATATTVIATDTDSNCNSRGQTSTAVGDKGERSETLASSKPFTEAHIATIRRT
jgi:hypothetical protein